MDMKLQKYIARAIIRNIAGDREYFIKLMTKAIGIHEGVYGANERLHVPIKEMARIRRLGA